MSDNIVARLTDAKARVRSAVDSVLRLAANAKRRSGCQTARDHLLETIDVITQDTQEEEWRGRGITLDEEQPAPSLPPNREPRYLDI